MRARFIPVERFPKINGRVQLRHGDLAFLAEHFERTSGHIARVIEGERSSAELAGEIEALVGVPLTNIDLPRKRQAA